MVGQLRRAREREQELNRLERFTALGNWLGGQIVREAKVLTPSACNWAYGTPEDDRIYYGEILRRAIRCPDPMARVEGTWLLRRLSPMISARLATGLHPVGATLMAIFGPVMAIPFVLLHGAGNGMLTIARGTLPLALFGPASYGLRTGILSAPARILQGGAPVLFGIVLDQGGPLYALLLSGTLTGLSFLALLTLSAAASRAAAPADG